MSCDSVSNLIEAESSRDSTGIGRGMWCFERAMKIVAITGNKLLSIINNCI